jgi:hypothetical protein
MVEGRADVAGEVMDAAAGLTHPPELSLLRTVRSGRGVSSSVVLALQHRPAAQPPADRAQLALLSPLATLDASVAREIVARLGDASAWRFDVTVRAPGAPDVTASVTLADLGLTPPDALAVTRTTLERLAVVAALGPAAEGSTGEVIGGDAGIRYESAAALVELIGRTPATVRAVAEDRAGHPPGDAVDPELIGRYAATRSVAAALADELRAQVALLAPNGTLGTADEGTLERLMSACASWGIAPDPPPATPTDDAATDPGEATGPAARRQRRLAATARLALPQLEARVASAPDAVAAAQLERSVFLRAAAALVSPTGQVALTATLPAEALPPLAAEHGLDADWLTVVAAVRPRLARLEAHQLGATEPFRAAANRPGDVWQQDAADVRPLIVAYAAPGLDLTNLPAGRAVAVAALDQFDEVIPDADQITGAAFGFDAPAARAQQAILLSVPPVMDVPLDPATLMQILAETRELAHARMARPIDIEDQLRAFTPTALLPATGAVATPLEVRA